MSAPWADWMKFYTGRYLSSDDVLVMSCEERGAYSTLLFQQSEADDGYLPISEDLLRKKARATPEEWKIVKETILPKFVVVEGEMQQGDNVA